MSAQPAAAETIGNYVIERSLAQGSMGHVYVARHQLTYARVALKVLRSELAADAHAEERFLREVRAAAQIGHEGIVKVLDAGCDPHGRLYLAMELLSGETLEDRMARQPGQRLALMRWIASALAPLAAAHAQGIIHRDLKPANLFIARVGDGSEQLKLLDFGLARDVRQKSRTETGIALGTPYYMSPEQAMRPKQVGPASDVWALGVMMYEVLSGHMPFDGETLHAVVLQSTTQPHVPLATRRPELDAALCELVEACLNKAPDQRPSDASALLSHLSPLLEDTRICAQLEQPLALPRDAADRGEETSEDSISYADTAMALPAPRLDASDASYAPRRPANFGMFIPVMLSALVLGAATFGYVKFAPATHTRLASSAPRQTAPTSLPVPHREAVGALAHVPSNPSPSRNSVLPPTESTTAPQNAATGPSAHKTESQQSAARDAHPGLNRAKPPAAAKRPANHPKKSGPKELPLPNAAAEVSQAEPVADLPAPTPDEPAPAEGQGVAWDEIDAQLRANTSPTTDAREGEPAPPSGEQAPATGTPAIDDEAPTEPVQDIESLPPPEPPTEPAADPAPSP